MKQKQNILVFGELLVRLSSATNNFFSTDQVVKMYPGGSEANVAASLAQWKVPVSYVTAIPDNAFAKSTLKTLTDLGVNTADVLMEGSRLGLYLLLSANGLTSGEVVYDRKFSSFSALKPGTIDWDQLMEGKTWFHWSALTPALSSDLALITLEALEAAKRNGLMVSVDLNYRNRLWDYGKQPIEVMPALAQYCDVIMGNIWAADKMLGAGIDPNLDRYTPSKSYFEHATNSAAHIFQAYGKCKHIANTFRFMDNPGHNLFYGTYHNKNNNYISEVVETEEVLDRIGSGDAFMAGLIHGLITEMAGQQIIDHATSAGFKKLFVKGDFGDGAF